MRKIKYIALVLIALFVILAFKSGAAQDPFYKLKTLTQVIRLVQDGYFEDFDMTEALEGAIRGFLEELDPHSKYISNKELPWHYIFVWIFPVYIFFCFFC